MLKFLKTKFDDFNDLKKVKICLKKILKKCPGKLRYDRDFTISFFKKDYFNPVRFLDGRFLNDSCCWFYENLPDKNYFFIYGKRQKNNNVKVIIKKLN